jgi:hypothetical protein
MVMLAFTRLSRILRQFSKTGLFSATVAAFIIESYKKLSPDSGDTTVALLAQISQQLAGVSFETSPQNLTSLNISSFKPTTTAVRVNILWFLILVLSLTFALSATLVQQWARRYQEFVQRRGAPHKRARIRAYVFDGVRGTKMYRAVEAIPLLLHISVFFFLAGLIDFLFPINETVSFYIIGYIAAFIIVYAVLTILPNLILNCPYRTPLTGFAWRISQVFTIVMLLIIREIERTLHEVLLSLWHRTNRSLTGLHIPRPARWRETLEVQIRTRRKWLANELRQSIMLSATGAPWKVDTGALPWTLTVLDEEGEIEDFVARIPGFFDSPTAPDATSAILALMDIPSDRSDPILGSRIHDLLKTCKPGASPLVEDARRNRLRVCLKSLWYCGRGYNRPGYPAPLPSYVREVFAVPEMILQIIGEEDVSVRLVGRCFESLLAKKLAQDVIDYPQRYSRAGTGLFVTQSELMSLSTLLGNASGDVIKWLGQRGGIGLANIVSLASSEVELLVTDNVPSEALDILQKTLEILVKELPHLSRDISDDLVLQFCKLYSKVDNVWSTIWLKYKLRPIHERLLGTNSVYSSAWSQMRYADDSHQWVAGAAPLTGNQVPSHAMALVSANWRAPSDEIDILPEDGQSLSDDTTSMDYASVVSLFQPSTNWAASSGVLPLADPEMEPIPVTADEQPEMGTVAAPEHVSGLTAVIHRGPGEGVEGVVAMTE